MKLEIVIPCYNEALNIPLILERFKSAIKDDSVHLLLVNNGSKDHSDEVLKELIPKYSFARSLKIEVNQGYGYGILQGLKATTSTFIGWTHADMQTDPADLIKAWDLLKENQNPESIYVKGLRKGRPIFDSFFTFGMGVFESIYLSSPLWDINAQPNIFHKSFFEKWKNPPSDFSLDLYSLYAANRLNIKIVRFPVVFPPRIHGESSWNHGFKSKWKFIKRTIEFSLKLKKDLEF